ncbi:hypothetical protein JYU34_004368 [Plutella xylostella]|uniref:Uncharacterized protein n=2 Tax=Plutella xylostella TaxID=51655 RepID=A0ABQ7QXU1_PLUXY|nr:hypothetical protein JYU34_004368 [Plutella xylostella]CAG9133543.1 unnamed protein product [Plutella xylostella]
MIFIERNGGVVLLRNGHQYTKIRTDNKTGAEVWRCVKWRKKCGATVTLKEGCVPSETAHICQPDYTANFIAKTKYECKKKVMTSDLASVPQTYNKFIAEIKETNIDMMHHMPSFRSVKSAMYAIRGKQFGVKKRSKKSSDECSMGETE